MDSPFGCACCLQSDEPESPKAEKPKKPKKKQSSSDNTMDADVGSGMCRYSS